jgi:hypothetical protein
MGDNKVWLADYKSEKLMGSIDSPFNGKAPYIFDKTRNPTAENIAEELFCWADSLVPNPLKVVHVRIWETPNCYADYFEPGTRTVTAEDVATQAWLADSNLPRPK